MFVMRWMVQLRRCLTGYWRLFFFIGYWLIEGRKAVAFCLYPLSNLPGTACTAFRTVLTQSSHSRYNEKHISNGGNVERSSDEGSCAEGWLSGWDMDDDAIFDIVLDKVLRKAWKCAREAFNR